MDGIPELIKGLLKPEAYQEQPSAIELCQTHISYLIFTPEFVYKIKKPVDFGFLDYTTLESRLRLCNEELRLNRRLSPHVYLGVVGITEKDGGFYMGGSGEPVEYAVKMRRLDEGRKLSRLLEKGEASTEVIKRIALVIAAFHATAETNERISGFGSIGAIRNNTNENFEQTAPFVGNMISRGLYAKIREFTDDFLSENSSLLKSRMNDNFIRDCHGDIHSEHVFIENGIEIIDCIEFNERFRYSDVIADAAFLSMDLDCFNQHGLSAAFDAAYLAATGDYQGARLMDLYRCYRAYVRGKVEGLKAQEPEVEEKERDDSFIRAALHFHLSGLYASGGFRPMMVVVCGPSGTGKSTLAAELSNHTGFVRLSSDRIRKELAGVPAKERRKEPFGGGIYSDEFTARTYAELLRRAAGLLKEGRSVVLDATFGRRAHLIEARNAAQRARAIFRVVECTALNSTVRERLSKRGAAPEGVVSDADWAIYLKQKALFEEIKEPHAELKAEEPFSEGLKAVVSAIFG